MQEEERSTTAERLALEEEIKKLKEQVTSAEEQLQGLQFLMDESSALSPRDGDADRIVLNQALAEANESKEALIVVSARAPHSLSIVCWLKYM